MAEHAILIVHYNCWDYLRRCLASLRDQTLGDFSLYVLDNCSDEPVPDDIRQWPDLHLIECEKNLGFAAGCNLLLRKARDSTWSLLLNPDAAADPTWFENMVRAGEQFPENTFFCSRLISEDRQLLDGDGDCYHISGLVWRQGHGKAVPDSNGYQEVFSACGAAAMYRTSSVLEAGGFDEDFFCYVEDVDLGFRLRLRGERCLLVPDAVVAHAGGVSSGGQMSSCEANVVFWCLTRSLLMPAAYPVVVRHLSRSPEPGLVLFQEHADESADTVVTTASVDDPFRCYLPWFSRPTGNSACRQKRCIKVDTGNVA